MAKGQVNQAQLLLLSFENDTDAAVHQVRTGFRAEDLQGQDGGRWKDCAQDFWE